MRGRRLSPQRATRAVQSWNNFNPVGTRVNVRRDNGETFNTVTRSIAFMTESNDAVIMVDGVSGYYRLDRVTPDLAEVRS